MLDIKEIPIKRSEMIETIMNTIVRPSGHECYFMLKQLDAKAVEDDIDGDNATFQAKLSKSPSGAEFNNNVEAVDQMDQPSSNSISHFRKGSSENDIKGLVAGAKDSIRMKDLLLKMPKRLSSSQDQESESSDFSHSPISPTSSTSASETGSPRHSKIHE